MAGFVISANRVHDGSVVYLDSERAWTSRLAAAATVPAKEQDAVIAWARTQEALVCDPHAIKVRDGDDGPEPVDTKQRIRAAGPDATLAALGFLRPATPTAPVHLAEVEA